ncbi:MULTISPECIES: glycerate kinase [Kocuria]|jgi:glycerate kinase|uniref:glycerate kinase n=1 Tax=Kocuria TaxID=57493 RepID=UPI000375058D|nr:MULTISPECIES: glycerate kinase [Kocuria]EYT47575.1 glycerate kinase [Kocuria sp. UCD-OTCP]PWF79888.1 glycerate kinase [Kocuria rosea]STX04066.1 Glycerate kinase [Kocuria rosea]VEH41095.1 Glycerate kinase [Kocuria rosea]
MSANLTTTPRILIAPDKFKGSLTASQVAESLAAGLRQENPLAQVHTLPLADGGDGSVAAALGAGFQALTVPITGPTGEPATTTVAFNGTTAVVEVATTAGLQMLPAGHLAPLESSSVGFGQTIRSVLAHRPARIVLALGGSATTDGGAGMLSALGVGFTDRQGQAFVPTGGTLEEIAEADLTGLVDLTGVELIAANDVDNPLLGLNGAAAVYGPQKGATPDDVEALEAGLGALIRRLWEAGWPAEEAAGVPGAGAAGGLGYAAMLLGARMVSGADFFLDLLGFDTQVTGCDLVITGEGKLDTQTLSGKLPVVVARRAAPVPVIAVVGHNALGTDRLPAHGIKQVYALSAMTEADSATDPQLSAALLRETGQTIARTLTPASSTTETADAI